MHMCGYNGIWVYVWVCRRQEDKSVQAVDGGTQIPLPISGFLAASIFHYYYYYYCSYPCRLSFVYHYCYRSYRRYLFLYSDLCTCVHVYTLFRSNLLRTHSCFVNITEISSVVYIVNKGKRISFCAL